MEGGNPKLARLIARQLFHAFAHLAGGLIGEGDGQYMIGIDGLLRQKAFAVGIQPIFQARFQMRALFGRIFHLAGAVIGVAKAHHVGDALGQHGRFARACARQHQQGAVNLKDCLALLRVQESVFLFQHSAAELLIVFHACSFSVLVESAEAPCASAFFALMRSSARR